MNRKILVLLLVLATVVAWRAYLSDISNPYIVGDDARLVLLGVLRFSNPDWFPSDLLTDYAEEFVTPGTRILYFLSANFIDPIAFSKIISFFIFVISVFFFLKLMYEITSSKITSILAVLFFVSVSTFKHGLSGGFPRSFSILLIICFLYFLIKRSWLKVFLTLTASTLIHPLSFLICYGTFLLSSFTFDKNFLFIDRNKGRLITLSASFIVGALILVPPNLFYSSPHIGKTMGPSLAKAENVYYSGGRPGSTLLPTPNVLEASYQRLISPFALNTRAKILDKKGFSKQKSIVTKMLFLLVIGLALFAKVKWGTLPIPKEIVCHLLSGVGLYLLANLVFIKLYFPDRYILSFDLISVIVVFSVISTFWESRDYLRAKLVRILAITLVSLVIILSSDFSKSVGMHDYSYEQPMLSHISGLPNESLIAAYPMGIADNIPLFSKRKVFVFYEASNPFHINHWNFIKERTIAFFDAYYSGSLSEIEYFMETNGINYLLVDLNHFTEEFLSSKQIYFNPFSDYIAALVKDRNNFALQQIPSEFWDYSSNTQYIISIEKIKESLKLLS